MEERKEIAVRALYAINRILENSGLTQTALAQQLECKTSKFTEILKGRMLVPTEMMSLLCCKYNVSAKWLLTGSGETFSDEQAYKSVEKVIPLLPFSAVAGYLTDGNGAETFVGQQVAVPDFTDRGADCAIRVDGDSMHPRYNNGDILAIRILKDPTFFQWGRVYVLSTNQGCVVKKLFPDPDDNNGIICHSENAENYPDYKIRKEDVLGVAIVVGHAGVE